MTNDLIQFALYGAVLVALAIPLGAYMTRVFAGEAGFLRFVERPVFSLAGIKPDEGQHWSAYALALIAFNAAGFVLLFLILKFQNVLPGNPLGLPRPQWAPRVQHSDQLHHQHQLAGLWRRNHHELSEPNGGADDAELRVGVDRHGGCRRRRPRAR